MKSLVIVVFVLILLPVSSAYTQQRRLTLEDSRSEKRVALVIGNGAYINAPPLKNPVNDAQDIAEALREFGFEVIYKENLIQNDMKRAFREFGAKLRNSGIGLFYYAGHGIAAKGINYLVPVDAKVESEEELEYECVDAGFVLAQMDSAANRLNIVILDACRNNPFARSFRSVSRGLAQMDAPSGTLIAYSTAPGSVASDGNARNGLYTQELLKFVRTPNLSIEEVFKQVRISVRSLTQGKQTPWESSSLTGDFHFTVEATNQGASFPTNNTISRIGVTIGGEWNGIATSGNSKFLYKVLLSQIEDRIEGTIRISELDGSNEGIYKIEGKVFGSKFKFAGTQFIKKTSPWCMATGDLQHTIVDGKATLEGTWGSNDVEGGCPKGVGGLIKVSR